MMLTHSFMVLACTARFVLSQQALCDNLEVSDHTLLYPEINGVYILTQEEEQDIYFTITQTSLILLSVIPDSDRWVFAEEEFGGEETITVLESGHGESPDLVESWSTIIDQDLLTERQDFGIKVNCIGETDPTQPVPTHSVGHEEETPDLPNALPTRPVGQGETPVPTGHEEEIREPQGQNPGQPPAGVPNKVTVFIETCDSVTHEICISCYDGCSSSSQDLYNSCANFPKTETCEINSPDATIALSYNQEFIRTKSYGQNDLSYTFVYNKTGVYMKTYGTFDTRLSSCGSDTLKTFDYNDRYKHNDCSFDSTVKTIFSTDFVPEINDDIGNNDPNSKNLSDGGGGISTTGIVLIVVLVFFAAGVITVSIIWFYRRQKTKRYSERLLGDHQHQGNVNNAVDIQCSVKSFDV